MLFGLFVFALTFVFKDFAKFLAWWNYRCQEFLQLCVSLLAIVVEGELEVSLVELEDFDEEFYKVVTTAVILVIQLVHTCVHEFLEARLKV